MATLSRTALAVLVLAACAQPSELNLYPCPAVFTSTDLDSVIQTDSAGSVVRRTLYTYVQDAVLEWRITTSGPLPYLPDSLLYVLRPDGQPVSCEGPYGRFTQYAYDGAYLVVDTTYPDAQSRDSCYWETRYYRRGALCDSVVQRSCPLPSVVIWQAANTYNAQGDVTARVSQQNGRMAYVLHVRVMYDYTAQRAYEVDSLCSVGGPCDTNTSLHTYQFSGGRRVRIERYLSHTGNTPVGAPYAVETYYYKQGHVIGLPAAIRVRPVPCGDAFDIRGRKLSPATTNSAARAMVVLVDGKRYLLAR